MEDIIQILIIIIVIAFAVVKQVVGNSEKEKKQRPKMRLPQENKKAEDTEYKRTGPEPFLSYEYDLYDSPQETTQQPSAKKKNKETEQSPSVGEGSGEKQEFDIQSSEEVRRGIIWSEILNRKY